MKDWQLAIYIFYVYCRVGVTDLPFMQVVINGSLRSSLRLDGWDRCAARYTLRRRRRVRKCILLILVVWYVSILYVPVQYLEYVKCTCTIHTQVPLFCNTNYILKDTISSSGNDQFAARQNGCTKSLKI